MIPRNLSLTLLFILFNSTFAFTSTPPPLSKFSLLELQPRTKYQRFLFNRQENLDFTFTQVISDVDDTIKSSGGVNVAGVALGGIDVQYDRGEIYPGVTQFMLELSSFLLPPKTESMDKPFAPPKIAVLTARAEEFKAALKLKSTSKVAVAFRETGKKAGYDDWGLGPVLYGSVAEWVVQDRKGMRKFSNFERLLQQDPTEQILQYIYVGDTGELDQEAGEQMLRNYPQLVKAVFLHTVSGEEWSGEEYLPIPPARLINGRPLIFFRTYVGAAAKAAQLGLMGEDGLLRVVKTAEQELIEKGVEKGDAKWRDLQRDIADALRTITTPISSEQFQYTKSQQ